MRPDHLLTYAVTLPEIGEVRGTRRIGALRVTGLSPARPAPDTVQITLTHDYTAQMETEFEIADYIVMGHTRVFGSATLRDNKGNVGRINIGFDGTVTGTITRETRVVGRFEGKSPPASPSASTTCRPPTAQRRPIRQKPQTAIPPTQRRPATAPPLILKHLSHPRPIRPAANRSVEH